MQKTLNLLTNFETRNNISVRLEVYSDGENTLYEFWEDTELKESASIDELHEFLKNTQYRLTEDGRCIRPEEIV